MSLISKNVLQIESIVGVIGVIKDKQIENEEFNVLNRPLPDCYGKE